MASSGHGPARAMPTAPGSLPRESTRETAQIRRSHSSRVGTTSTLEGAIVRRRVLDLQEGTLRSEVETPRGDVRILAFASLARPGTAALVVEGPGLVADSRGPLVLPASDRGHDGDRWQMRGKRGGVTVAASERAARIAGGRVRLERLVAYATDPEQPPRPEAALEALEAAERIGVESLLAEQRSEWARRWSAADIRIEGDPDLQRAVRFSLFHLMASVADRPQAALGARGLSGPGYRGHVFWDTDVFVLPFLAATHPPAAGALVGYRVARLAAARSAAARMGFEGARFPWESADSGDDITPTALPDASGQARASPDRRAGGAHHRRRRVGDGAVPELERQPRDAPGLPRSDRRDRALLGLADPCRRRRSRPHRRRHRPRRVPRERRRQRVHERHGPVEPRPRREPRGRRGGCPLARAAPPPSSMGSTLRPAATSSSRGTSGSSR